VDGGADTEPSVGGALGLALGAVDGGVVGMKLGDSDSDGLVVGV
jgi:hypothetical protein